MYYTKADIQQKDGKIYGVASSSVVDRQNEVVDVEGWDLKNFKKAPRLLWAHDHTEPAIGKVTKTWYEGLGKAKRLMFEAVFQDVTEKARAIKQLVQDGFINTFSVGFKPLEMDGNTIVKQELLEISVVNVPANPEAMLLAYKSLQNAGIEKDVIKDLGIETDDPDRIASLEEQLAKAVEVAEKAQQTADMAVKGLQHLNPQRSNREVVTKRLEYSKVIAKAADKLLETKSVKGDTASMVKIIKRSSEMLIRSNKGDL